MSRLSSFGLLLFYVVIVHAQVPAENSSNSPTKLEQAQPPISLKEDVIAQNIPMEGAYVSSKIGKNETTTRNKEIIITEKQMSQHLEIKEPPLVQAVKETAKTAGEQNEGIKITNKNMSNTNTNNVIGQITIDTHQIAKDTSKEINNKLPHKENSDHIENTFGPHKESSDHIIIKNKMTGLYNDMDITDSFKTGSYFFLAISSLAVLFIVFKIYRMRLTRAERKYGVQGNRSTQELTPLPMAIDDNGNSDDEDQTLFDRHQIRIL